MRNLKKLLFAGALTAAAVLSTPKPALAVPWCDLCAESGNCFYCCKCDGQTSGYCGSICP